MQFFMQVLFNFAASEQTSMACGLWFWLRHKAKGNLLNRHISVRQ